MYYAQQALDLSARLKYLFGKCAAQRSIFWALNSQGNYPNALELAFDNLKTAEKLKYHSLSSMALANQLIGLANRELEDYRNAMIHLRLSIRQQKESGEIWKIILAILFDSCHLSEVKSIGFSIMVCKGRT